VTEIYDLELSRVKLQLLVKWLWDDSSLTEAGRNELTSLFADHPVISVTLCRFKQQYSAEQRQHWMRPTSTEHATKGNCDPALFGRTPKRYTSIQLLNGFCTWLQTQFQCYQANYYDYIAPLVAVVQSTGTGKSRLLVEVCRLDREALLAMTSGVFVGTRYMVFRHDPSSIATWPFWVDRFEQWRNNIKNVFTSCKARIGETDHQKATKFFPVVRMFELMLLETLSHWYSLTEVLGDFKVIEMYGGDLPKFEAVTERANVKDLWQVHVSEAKDTIFRKFPGSESILLFVDEAGWLAADELLFRAFRSAVFDVYHILDNRLFVVVCGTNSRLQNFLPEEGRLPDTYRPVMRAAAVDQLEECGFIRQEERAAGVPHPLCKGTKNLRAFTLNIISLENQGFSNIIGQAQNSGPEVSDRGPDVSDVISPNRQLFDWAYACENLLIYYRPLWSTYYLYPRSDSWWEEVLLKAQNALKRAQANEDNVDAVEQKGSTESNASQPFHPIQFQYACFHVISHAPGHTTTAEELVRSLFYILDISYAERCISYHLGKLKSIEGPIFHLLHPADPVLAAAMLQLIYTQYQMVDRRFSSDTNRIEPVTTGGLSFLFRLLGQSLFRPPEMRGLTGYLAEEAVCLAILLSIYNPDIDFRSGVPYSRFSDVLDNLQHRFGFAPPNAMNYETPAPSDRQTRSGRPSVPVPTPMDQFIVSVVQFIRVERNWLTNAMVPWLLVHRTGLIISVNNESHVADILLPAKRVTATAVSPDSVASGSDCLIVIQVKYTSRAADGSLIHTALEQTQVPSTIDSTVMQVLPMVMIIQGTHSQIRVEQAAAVQAIADRRVLCSTVLDTLYMESTNQDPRIMMNFPLAFHLNPEPDRAGGETYLYL